MSAVQLIVGSAESFLTNAARSTFLGLVEASGTLVGYMAVLAVALVGINMMLQLRPMTWGHALSLMIKLTLIGIFAWNWNQFWAVAGGIQKAIEATAGGILASSGDGLSGPTITDGFATAIDDMMDSFTLAATNIAAEMGGWFVTAVVSGIRVIVLCLKGRGVEIIGQGFEGTGPLGREVFLGRCVFNVGGGVTGSRDDCRNDGWQISGHCLLVLCKVYGGRPDSGNGRNGRWQMMLFARWSAISARSRSWPIKAILTVFCSKRVLPFACAMLRPATTRPLTQGRELLSFADEHPG